MSLEMIERVQGNFEGRNKSVAYKDLVFTVATAEDQSLNFEQQTKLTFSMIEKNLKELSSSKENILSANVYLANMAHKPRMDEIWQQWLGNRQSNWPQRACLGVALEGNILIEVTVTAVITHNF